MPTAEETGILPSGTGENTRVKNGLYPLVYRFPIAVCLRSGPTSKFINHYLIRKGFEMQVQLNIFSWTSNR